ncbi:MAG TPA: protein phosphatase 2C domain-containing protein [Micropepsaceae bacterium]|jgi:serine/threonine protein phosphatase PrpC|nr:protein phosphatase 2C domain-containing protein [Micropepsaceae bacterium]
MTGFQFEAAGITDVGLKRRANEDSLLLRDSECLWVVADGMGGHRAGDWASGQIRDGLQNLALTGDFDRDLALIGNAVHAINARIFEESQKAGAMMGSTVVVLHCCGDRFAVFWAGDSRVYLRRGGELYRITTDHSEVQELVAAGLIGEEEARLHPRRNIITRAVGTAPELTLDVIADRLEAGDIFLLCSDGLTSVASDEEIGECLDVTPFPDITGVLLKFTLARGAPDNVTVAAILCKPA